MQRKYLVVTMLAVLIVGVTVGVLVWPPPEKALAIDQTINFAVEWQGLAIPHNVYPYVEFRDALGDVVFEMQMRVVFQWTLWTQTYKDVDEDVVSVTIRYNDVEYNWDIGSPQGPVQINWQNPQPINFGDACWEW